MRDDQHVNLTEREAAEFLNCSVALLRRWRWERKGPRWTHVGRLVRYPKAWLQDYLELNATPAPGTQRQRSTPKRNV